MILAGITVALCGKAHSCNDTLVDEWIQNTTALYKNSILCTNGISNKSVSQFTELAESITNQSSHIRDNQVFEFNRTVSFNDRNVNDTGQV